MSLETSQSLFSLEYGHNKSCWSNSLWIWGFRNRYFLCFDWCYSIFLNTQNCWRTLSWKNIAMLVFYFSISFLLQILNCTSANYNPAQIILYLPFLPKFAVLQLLIWMTVIYNHGCQSWITDCRVKGKQWLKCSCALQDIHKSFSVYWQILEGSTLRPWKLF